jgi:chaperonin GroEL
MKAVESVVEAHEGDTRTGAKILLRALEEPTRQIVHNAGVDEAAVIVREIRARGGTFGFDANTCEMADMIEAGIIDPAKVTKIALQNAASIAGLLLTTEAVVSELPEKKNKHMTPSSGEDFDY